MVPVKYLELEGKQEIAVGSSASSLQQQPAAAVRFFPNKNPFRKSVSNPAETKKYGWDGY
jgi:hypothetical protein